MSDDASGTWGLETPEGSYTIRGTYDDLVRLLGQPSGHTSEKITSEWVLLHDGGKFTIYDYKATSEYDPDLPSVSEFRKKPQNWDVGTDGSRAAAQGAALVKKALAQLRRSKTTRRRASRKHV